MLLCFGETIEGDMGRAAGFSCSLGEVNVCDVWAAFGNGFDATIRDTDTAAEIQPDQVVTGGRNAVQHCVRDARQPVELDGLEHWRSQYQAADAVVCEAAATRHGAQHYAIT